MVTVNNKERKMNKRIKELAKAYLVHERYTRYGEIVEEDLYEFYPDELEKFAKLIVAAEREAVIAIVNDNSDSDGLCCTDDLLAAIRARRNK